MQEPYSQGADDQYYYVAIPRRLDDGREASIGGILTVISLILKVPDLLTDIQALIPDAAALWAKIQAIFRRVVPVPPGPGPSPAPTPPGPGPIPNL